MRVSLVYVDVKPEYVEKFIEASRLNHKSSINESGNFRFDILQLESDPCKFVLYESYKNLKDSAKHKQTAHYQVWREAVANWMQSPREGVAYAGLFPSCSGKKI